MNLKNMAQKKLKKSGGFTLVEMLIVVAIIVILVVVSIPMISGSLNDAREATDAANLRAAKAAALIEYMDTGTAGTYYYNADTGEARYNVAPGTEEAGYTYGQSEEHKGGYVKVTITAEGVVDSNESNTGWVKPTTTTEPEE